MDQNQESFTRSYDNNLFEPKRKKKKVVKLILGLLGVVVIIAMSVVIIGPTKVLNSFYKTFAGKATYYAWVEKNNAMALGSSLLSTEKKASSYETRVKVLVSDTLDMLLPESEDLVFRANSDMKDGKTFHKIHATYGNEELLEVDTYTNVLENEFYLKLPQLSEKYVAVNSIFGAFNLNILKQANSTLSAYLSQLVEDSVEEVSFKDNTTLSIQDETITGTQITAVFLLADVIDELMDICEEMKIDEKLMDISEENGLKKSEYKSMFTTLLSQLQTLQGSLVGEEELTVVSYVDGEGRILGRTLEFTISSVPLSISYLIIEEVGNLHILSTVNSMESNYVTLDITSTKSETINEPTIVTEEEAIDSRTYGREVSVSSVATFLTNLLDQLGLSGLSESLVSYLGEDTGIEDNPESVAYVILGNYIGIEVTQPETTVTEEELQEEIIGFTQYYSNMMPITNRDTIEDSDLVLIDFAGKIDGAEFEGGTETDYELEIGSGMFIDDFEVQLIGKKVGEKVNIGVTFPKEYSDTELAGKDAKFDVTIKEIGVREFTDAFVAFNTEYETAEEYKDYLYDGLVESKEYDAQSQIEESILTSIIDASSFYNVSDGEIEAQKEEIISTYESYADYYGVGLEAYVDSIFSMTMDEFYEEVNYLADLYVKESYVLAEIAKQEQFTLSDEEYERRLREVMDKYDYETLEEIEAAYGGKEGLTTVFIEEMVLEFLKESAILK